jgi:hypothetical protein
MYAATLHQHGEQRVSETLFLHLLLGRLQRLERFPAVAAHFEVWHDRSNNRLSRNLLDRDLPKSLYGFSQCSKEQRGLEGRLW